MMKIVMVRNADVHGVRYQAKQRKRGHLQPRTCFGVCEFCQLLPFRQIRGYNLTTFAVALSTNTFPPPATGYE
jgi:hypothetical protein